MTDTPNPLKGNPYVEDVLDAVVFSADDSPMQTTELLLDRINRSVLALAFEVRTATLVALLDSGALGADYTQVAGQVRTRLGLENDDD